MPYTTKSAVRLRAKTLDSNITDDTTIDDAIADADAVIDAELEGIYTVPFTSTPKLIAMISRDLAAALLSDEVHFDLMARGYTYTGDMHRNAMKHLKNLKEGKSSLDVTENLNANRAQSNTYDADTDTKDESVFTMGDELTWLAPEHFDDIPDDIEDRL